MVANSYSIGQSVLTELGERVTITSTSDPTCLICESATGERITVRRSEVKNPVFETYNKKMNELNAKYTELQNKYRTACSNSEGYTEAIAFHCLKKDGILREAGTVSKFNLSSEERPNFDNHYDLYWENRFKLAASSCEEYNLTRYCGDVLHQMKTYKNQFGLA